MRPLLFRSGNRKFYKKLGGLIMRNSYIKHISYYFPAKEEWNDPTGPLTQKNRNPSTIHC